MADALKKNGFNLLSGPGNDLAGITAQDAAGSVLSIFTTGHGTPAGFAPSFLRITPNTVIAKLKPGWVDYNASALMEGKDINESAEELFNMVLEVAGGEAQTVVEAHWYWQIGFFRDGVTDLINRLEDQGERSFNPCFTQ